MIRNPMVEGTAQKDAESFGLRAGEMYVPSVFQSNKLLRLKAKEVRFLEAWMRLGEWDLALSEQNMGAEEAQKIITKRSNQEFLSDRMKEVAIRQGLTADWFMHELYKVYDGSVTKTRDQIEVLKAIGARVSPAMSHGTGSPEKITINVNVGAMKEAMDRQNAIETQVIQEGEASGQSDQV